MTILEKSRTAVAVILWFGIAMLHPVVSKTGDNSKTYTGHIEVGTQKQLLFDGLFLEKSSGITLRMNTPFQDPDPVLVADKPWEKLGICAYNTVMLETDTFRMWYDAITIDNTGKSRRFLCYAESRDGIQWEKPDLGLIEFDGSTRNNIVAPPTPNTSQQGGTVFRDDRAPASERYKLWTKYHGGPKHDEKDFHAGMWAMVSPDGLRWKLAYHLSKGNAADSQNICFWDGDLGKYVGFVRMKVIPPEDASRKRTCWVGLMTSDDFYNWTTAKGVFWADENMPVPGGKPAHLPVVDLYTPGGMKVPGVPNAYILLSTPYYHWDHNAFPSTIDVCLATSRDRITWWRPVPEVREPFLRLGQEGTASSGMIFANPWPIVIGDEIWIYYAGQGFEHKQDTRDPSLTGIFRARLRRDGFVSADAGYKGGEFTTPVLTFAGKRLELNMDGSAGGWLQAEILSPDGIPLEGYLIDQCDTIRGNSTAKAVTWHGSSDVSKLAGVQVRLRFVMRSMKLFAFQFVE